MARPKIEEQRREQILAAFEACVIRDGLAATTLADVAEEAKLPRSLVRYFVGNRDAMVEVLIARMVSRAQSDLLRSRQRAGSVPTVRGVVDYLFDRVFGDETTNAVVQELWELAKRDAETRERLAVLYATVVRELSRQLGAAPDVRTSTREIDGVAYGLLSLVYGGCSFRSLGMKGASHKGLRQLAYAMVERLKDGEGSEAIK